MPIHNSWVPSTISFHCCLATLASEDNWKLNNLRNDSWCEGINLVNLDLISPMAGPPITRIISEVEPPLSRIGNIYDMLLLGDNRLNRGTN